MFEYIYLLQEREFIKTNEPIYKIGKSKQENLKRICNYPNGTKLLFQTICTDCDTLEKELIKTFKDKYELQKDIGNEYFKGNYKEMIKDIYRLICIDDDTLEQDNVSNDEEDKIIEVNTYNEFMKHTFITDIIIIIITDKKKEEGYLKYPNHIWIRIWEKNRTDDNAETLSLWLENNSMDDSLYKFNYKNIIQDICDKCYIEQPYIYQLKYNEFIIKCDGNLDLILNTKSFTIKNCDEDIDNNIILNVGAGERVLYLSNETYIDNIDTNIIDDILSSLINDKNIIDQYRKLCYNILVEQKQTIIFEDYSHKCCLLSTWLNDLIFSICSEGHPYGYKCNFDEKQKAHYLKAFKKDKPRVVFIDDIYVKDKKTYRYNKTQIKKHIEFLKDLGIKNIVVNYSINNNQYNYKKYIEYIVENKEIIKQMFPIIQDKNYLDIRYYPDANDIDRETNLCNYDDIFYLTNMLFNNFLKWCCTF